MQFSLEEFTDGACLSFYRAEKFPSNHVTFRAFV